MVNGGGRRGNGEIWNRSWVLHMGDYLERKAEARGLMGGKGWKGADEAREAEGVG